MKRRFLLLFSILFSLQAFAQFTLTDNFEGSNVNNIVVLGGSPNPAMLTSGVSDPVNNGWLRITNSTMDQKGFAYVKTSFPSDLGILLDFEYKSWRSTADSYNGADGFSVFLFDADSVFAAGGYGGSLGYAPNTAAGIAHGMSGGYVGVGIDEYGNYSNHTEGRNGGPGLSPNSIALRGPTTNDPSTTNAYLAGYQINPDPTANAIDYNTVTPTRPTDAQFYRRVQVQMTASGGVYTVTVRWKTSVAGAFTQLIQYTLTTPPPPNLKVGFAATTGSGFNYHEVRNVIVTTPGNVSVTKRVDMTNAAVSSQVTYTVSALNYSPIALNGLILSDTLKDGIGNAILLSPSTFTVNSVTFNNNGYAGNTSAGYTNGTAVTTGLTNPLHINMNMAANSSSVFTIVGTINGMPAGSIVSNAVGIDPTPTGITDSDPTNNNFTVSTNVLSSNVDLAITNTLDSSCSNPSAGNTYLITVSNNGSSPTTSGTQTMVTDNIPAGFTITSASGTGWTATVTGNLCTFTRSDVLASGFAYPQIQILVLPPVSANNALDQATVVYAGGETNTANNSATVTLYSNPGPPVVNSPVLYTTGATPSPLTATGANLLWYNLPVGGVGSQTAPTPVTITAGTTTYYVSQTNGTCESALSSVQVTVTNAGTLPITLASFTATADQGRSRLDWITSMESNNTGFEIDRSADGQNWKDIGFKQSEAANGNSNLPLSYTIYDDAPLSGSDYYRLKQIDLDGKFSYSIVVNVNFGTNSKITISPNPASASVTITGVNAGQELRLMDLKGTILMEKMVSGEIEYLQIGRLAPGTYFLQIFGNGKLIGTIKLLKQ